MMKKLKNIAGLLLGGILAFTSCETTDLDLLDNPNQLPPENIALVDGLNGLQFSLLGVFQSAQGMGATATRLQQMFGTTYENAYPPDAAGGAWNTGYAGILLDSQFVLDNAEALEADDATAVTKVLRAYTLMTLVDLWGDIPLEEALQGTGNFNPALSPGEDAYAMALTELNEATALLTDLVNDGSDMPNVSNFFFVNSDNVAESWLRAANTMKLRYYLNIGDAAGFTATLGLPIIEDNSDNMTFQYGTAVDPESRHPNFVRDYDDGTPNVYMSNDYMFQLTSMTFGGNNPYGGDPRAPYYFNRQTDSFPGPADNPSIGDALPCFDDPNPYPAQFAFCAFGPGFWGRDHGESGGIPPDSDLRTTYGLYPSGGQIDDPSSGIDDESGLQGEGIAPVLLASHVDFWIAEAVLTLGVTGTAITEISEGMEKHMRYVYSMPDGFDETAIDPADDAAIVAYRDAVIGDAGTTDLQKLGSQFWAASFGSGLEMYNFYRRNGEAAINLQPHLFGSGAGPFPRSLFYLNNTANLNNNIDQKANLTELVFWDNGSATVQ